MFGMSVTLDPSIQSHPFGAQNFAVFMRPSYSLLGPADLARPYHPRPYHHRLDLHNRPKAAPFDVEMRRQVIIGIDRDLAGREAADGRHSSGLRKAMIAALSR